MSGEVAILDYQRCQPAECENGICTAAEACARNLLKQEMPYELPKPPLSLCPGCFDCVEACPYKAVQIMRVIHY